MRKIVLIACCSTKLDREAPARDLYQSQLFRKSLRWAEGQPGVFAIHVLSALHGVVNLDQDVAPYDHTLNTVDMAGRLSWADLVDGQLRDRGYRLMGDEDAAAADRFVFLAGSNYRFPLSKRMANVDVPMKHLGIGEQLRYLTKAITEPLAA